MAITRLVVMLCSYAMVAHAVVSQTPQSPPEQVETVRINTKLVQTDVMVFDKQGKFVPGLRLKILSFILMESPIGLVSLSWFQPVVRTKNRSSPPHAIRSQTKTLMLLSPQISTAVESSSSTSTIYICHPTILFRLGKYCSSMSTKTCDKTMRQGSLPRAVKSVSYSNSRTTKPFCTQP